MCGRSYATSGNFNRHKNPGSTCVCVGELIPLLEMLTDIKRSTKKPRKYMCVCRRTYTTSGNVNWHTKTWKIPEWNWAGKSYLIHIVFIFLFFLHLCNRNSLTRLENYSKIYIFNFFNFLIAEKLISWTCIFFLN